MGGEGGSQSISVSARNPNSPDIPPLGFVVYHQPQCLPCALPSGDRMQPHRCRDFTDSEGDSCVPAIAYYPAQAPVGKGFVRGCSSTRGSCRKAIYRRWGWEGAWFNFCAKIEISIIIIIIKSSNCSKVTLYYPHKCQRQFNALPKQF